GNAGKDALTGGDGADYLFGNQGNDIATGGGGGDYIFGYEDNDILTGGPGNDIIEGGTGNDRVLGGDEDDRLMGEPTGSDGSDLATDFVDGGGQTTTIPGDVCFVRAAGTKVNCESIGPE
ncbi:MAG TPA: hypothetical protein VFO77_04845, partial [Actinoplanes sp.]|nr:hypothetical protein [Actinoplanes sp.]